MMWKKRESGTIQIRELSEKLGIDLLTSSILSRRGIKTPAEALFYLEDDSRFLHNPFLFSEMEDAVDRIMLAVDEGEKVMIFGDRDADGISSTTLLMETFSELGLDVCYRLPDKDEKYGLSTKAVDECAEKFISLIVTVDCGISNHSEVNYAAQKGIDVIIVDHHVLQSEEAPKAIAILNPKLPNSTYPFRDLSGCGVAYKLSWALRFAQTDLYKQEVALLNVRPLNESYLVEAVCLTNLVETQRISEPLVPGVSKLENLMFVKALKNRQIFVWDGEIQKRLLLKALGKTAEVNFYDIRMDIGRVIPQAAGASLLRLASVSKIEKYTSPEPSEIDTFINLFTSFALQSTKIKAENNANKLELVALSTISDVMPLVNENRILVRIGLAHINKNPRKGFAELIARQNLIGKKLCATDIAWQLSPVINAAGRMGKPDVAVDMLLSDDASIRASKADELITMNQERRKLGNDTWDAYYSKACEFAEKAKNHYVIISGSDINRGITGNLASRLADNFKIPAIVAAIMQDGTTVASIRSAGGFNVKGLLEYCSELFIDFGGHDAAAGFSLLSTNWEKFLSMADQYLSAIDLDNSEEILDIDAELPHNYMNNEIFKIVDRFEPFGEACPALQFLSKAVPICDADIIGKTEKSHLKLVLDFGTNKWPALWWNSADKYQKEFVKTDKLDVVYKIQKNYWNGMETPQLIILDAKKAN